MILWLYKFNATQPLICNRTGIPWVGANLSGRMGGLSHSEIHDRGALLRVTHKGDVRGAVTEDVSFRRHVERDMEPKLTDERLKNWPNANQPARERLCLALLTFDSRFENPRPRRPSGPDGARDIEVVFRGIETWGSVGFRDDADDSEDDKKWTKRKFKDDVLAALAEKPDLTSFVFLTNVELTPGELNEMGTYAGRQGIRQSEILGRERLRILLDGAAGLGLRYRYLNIPLSEAEQAAFFERFGPQLERLMLNQFDHVDERLARIEFLHACARPLTGIEIVIALKRRYSPAELGHFRVLCGLINVHELEPHPTLWIGCRDAYSDGPDSRAKPRKFGCNSLVWSSNPDGAILSAVSGTTQTSAHELRAGGSLQKRRPYPTLAAMDESTMWVFVTRPLFEQIQTIGLVAQGYVLTAANVEDLEAEDTTPLVAWPEPLTENETKIPWVLLQAKREPGSAPWTWPRSWSLDFSKFTPRRTTTAALSDRRDGPPVPRAYDSPSAVPAVPAVGRLQLIDDL